MDVTHTVNTSIFLFRDTLNKLNKEKQLDADTIKRTLNIHT